MSRCFPYPPPGYELKQTKIDLLKEEKRKDKKHKKEKKDKEKRESKDKKEKDRSDGKHKEKKDRKEKHKDKKEKRKDKKEKEKDRSKDKEGSSISEEARVARVLEGENGEKLYSKDDNKPAVRFPGQYDGMPSENSNFHSEAQESKLLQELCRRTQDAEKGTGTQLADRSSSANWTKEAEHDQFTVRGHGNSIEKDKNMDKRFDIRKIDEQGLRQEPRHPGGSVVQNSAPMARSKIEERPRQTEGDKKERTEEKEKSKERGGDKRRDRDKDRDRDKRSHGKDKDRNKEKKEKQNEKAKENSEIKKSEQEPLKNNRSDLGVLNNKILHTSKEHSSNALVEQNPKKRKDVNANGFSHESEVRPDKLPRLASHQAENGRNLEACQTPIPYTSDKLRVASDLKVDNVQRRINGVVHLQPSSIPSSRPRPPPELSLDELIAEASKKPPHPDFKYLDQVLSIPKMEERSEADDQEWLFTQEGSPSKRCEVGSSTIEDDRQVWSEAMHIESADVCALPYVIPY